LRVRKQDPFDQSMNKKLQKKLKQYCTHIISVFWFYNS